MFLCTKLAKPKIKVQIYIFKIGISGLEMTVKLHVRTCMYVA